MATWPSGKAGACKALTTGSNPVVASKLFNPFSFREYICVYLRTPYAYAPSLRGMCGSATLLAPRAPDVWQCHVFRAGTSGCVAVPRFSRRKHRMCGSATLLARKDPRERRMRGSATVLARGINLAQGMGDKEGATPSRMRPLRYQFGGPTRIRTWSLSIMSRSR